MNIKEYIPLDKSWIIRMGILDILNNKDDIIKFLEKQKVLSDDLDAFYQASIAWKSNKPIDIGESGTLYRFLKFASWKLNLNKEFIIQGTLKTRNITDNSKIVNYSLKELLKLDNGTSQWASASVLLGNKEVIDNPPYKLKLTYDAISHWNNQKAKNKSWLPRYDETILNQAITFLELLNNKKPNFTPKQSEDYCFARAFGYIIKEDGESKWSSLKGHESNRIEEMEKMIRCADLGEDIDSKDHRVIQAITMKQKVDAKDVNIKYPKSVNKSWPQFWRFLKDSEKLINIK